MPFKSRYNVDFTGDINYGRKVVVSIISLAVMEIRGVARLQGRKVRAEFSGDTIRVDVHIDVLRGFNCADVAFRVQENVKRNVESITGYKTKSINVNVLGVVFADRPEKG
ncbi:MAG: Asp23/Gls24 family envelope stress response protein [Clostridiales bacterium]|jgi:uncharacterized alkaline shock family protein YloU|nr:Asp23/Gls24 family envelope stress response protein [Clostridiales bacterium]